MILQTKPFGPEGVFDKLNIKKVKKTKNTSCFLNGIFRNNIKNLFSKSFLYGLINTQLLVIVWKKAKTKKKIG
jgi:hypothetical protein